MRKKTRVVLVESISNPTMKVCDVWEIARIAHEFGSKLIVDNTFATPFVERPRDLRADVVMHSGIKFQEATMKSLSECYVEARRRQRCSHSFAQE